MIFKVGPFQYVVRRTWALTLDGDPVDGFCASTSRCIYLDGDLEADALVSTLRHEHEHAWEYEVGQPRTAEDRANFMATVGTSFDQQFSDQGGTTALINTPIEGIANPRRRLAQKTEPIFTDRVHCGGCGTQIMAGSIYSSEPMALEQSGIVVLERGCQCPVCDRVQVWTERSTADGLPAGEYLRARMLAGAEAVKWLDEHRELYAPFNDC